MTENQDEVLEKSRRTQPEEVADRLHSAAIHLLRSLKGRDKVLGITPAQLSALSVLYFMGPLAIGKLAKAEGVKPPTISRLVKDMVRLGLVMREAGAEDARASVISITPKGSALFERGRTARLMALTSALSDLSGENLDLLRDAARLMETTARAVRES